MGDFKLYDKNNFGCNLRDKIYENINNLKSCQKNGMLIGSLLVKKFDKIKIPKQYWGDVIYMCEYRKLDRMTDMIEKLLQDIVIQQMIVELIDEGSVFD